MAESKRGWSDEQVEQVVGNLLRAGVISAAAVVLVGGMVFLIQNVPLRHSPVPAEYYLFDPHSLPPELRSPLGIVTAAGVLRGRGLIQLGLLLLIATPVARVIFSVFAFARQRDVTYVIVTLIVLAVLLFSLFNAHLGT